MHGGRSRAEAASLLAVAERLKPTLAEFRSTVWPCWPCRRELDRSLIDLFSQSPDADWTEYEMSRLGQRHGRVRSKGGSGGTGARERPGRDGSGGSGGTAAAGARQRPGRDVRTRAEEEEALDLCSAHRSSARVYVTSSSIKYRL